jgi:hypothetical protein
VAGAAFGTLKTMSMQTILMTFLQNQNAG